MEQEINIYQKINELEKIKKPFKIKVKNSVNGRNLIPYDIEVNAYKNSVSPTYYSSQNNIKNIQKKRIKDGDILTIDKVSFDKTNKGIDFISLKTDDGYGIIDKNSDNFKIYYLIVEDKPVSESKKGQSDTKLVQDLNNSPLGKTARKVQIGFSVIAWGVFGVLAYKFWNKSTTWKVMLSVFGAYNLYNTYKVFNKPALKVSKGSDSNTQIETGTETGVLDKSNDKLTKQEKIDLIIKIQRGNQPADEDSENNTITFLNTLNDADLSIWIPLSKALKDEQVNSAMAKNIDEGFKLVESKYGITRKQAEEQNKKLAQFFATIFESAGFKSTENNSMFSNFESSLNLDI